MQWAVDGREGEPGAGEDLFWAPIQASNPFPMSWAFGLVMVQLNRRSSDASCATMRLWGLWYMAGLPCQGMICRICEVKLHQSVLHDVTHCCAYSSRSRFEVKALYLSSQLRHFGGKHGSILEAPRLVIFEELHEMSAMHV